MYSAVKQPTHRSKAWLKAVASLPCVLCKTTGRTQAAHMNQGKGMGLKTHDCWTAALCVECHSGIDQGAHLDKAARRDLMERAVLLTIAQLACEGLVRPV